MKVSRLQPRHFVAGRPDDPYGETADAILAIAQPPSTPEVEAVRVAIAALEKIASRTEDKLPPFRGMEADQMQQVARGALTALRRSGEGV